MKLEKNPSAAFHRGVSVVVSSALVLNHSSLESYRSQIHKKSYSGMHRVICKQINMVAL